MILRNTATRKAVSTVALASALAVASSAAIATPALRVDQVSANDHAAAVATSAHNVSQGNQPGDQDPTAFSRMAHEQSARDSAASDNARPGQPDREVGPETTHDNRDISAHRNRYQQPNQAWSDESAHHGSEL